MSTNMVILQLLPIIISCDPSFAFISPSLFLARSNCACIKKKAAFDHVFPSLNGYHQNGPGQQRSSVRNRNVAYKSAVPETKETMDIENSSQEGQNLVEKSEEGGSPLLQVVESTNHVVEIVAILSWLSAICGFTVINNKVGPWPAFMIFIPERIYYLLHMVGGLAFGGGILLTTAIEWLVAQEKNKQVLSFWFGKVPLLDYAFVLPGLTVAMFSGIGLTIVRYHGLGFAPTHIKIVFWTLIAFASWWALTDLSTQGSALQAIHDWERSEKNTEVPEVVTKRILSNVVSCIFVLMIYVEMVLKPGTLAMENY